MRVSDVLDRNVLSIEEDRPLRDAAALFKANQWVNEIAVVDTSRRLMGVLRHQDVVDAVSRGLGADTSVSSICREVEEVLRKNQEFHPSVWISARSYVWVVDEAGRLAGIVDLGKLDHDIITNRLPLVSHWPPVVRSIKAEELEALEKSELFGAILESSFDGIYITDGKGVTLFVNKAWEKTSGLPRERVLGRSVQEMQQEGLYSRSVALLVLERKATVTIFQEYVTGRQALTTGNPVFDQEGKIVRVVCNVRDISGLLQLRKELQTTKELSLRYSDELRELRKQQYEGTVVARSKAFRQVLEAAHKAAQFDTTVLLLGESGVGKDVVARFIHAHSRRKDQPFIQVNCAAIPSPLFESEVFGYVKGSFTGADPHGKPGMFELASGGTIFLDEIADVPLEAQGKLLRAIQEKEVFKVGDRTPMKLDVRILSATNKDLKVEVEKGTFRRDLYFRLNVFPIGIPPLRERPEDIPALAFHFLERLNRRNKTHKTVTAEVMNEFLRYSWPGNARELENVVEFAYVTSPGEEITVQCLPSSIWVEGGERGLNEGHYRTGGKVMSSDYSQYAANTLDLKEARSFYERAVLLAALSRNQSLRKTARSLGISASTLLRKMRRYGIDSRPMA